MPGKDLLLAFFHALRVQRLNRRLIEDDQPDMGGK